MSDQEHFTGKQYAFILAYTDASGGTFLNGTASCRVAGYQGTDNVLAVQAHTNLRIPKINREVRRRIEAVLHVEDVTPAKVLRDLEVHRLVALQEGKISAANQASLLQGRYLKLFADRVEHVHSIEEATDDELAALLLKVLKENPGSVDVAGILGSIGGEQPAPGAADTGAGAPPAKRVH